MTRGSVAGCSLPGFGDGLSRGRVSRRGDALVPLPGFGEGYQWELGPLRCHVTETDTLGVAGNRRQRLREPGTGPMACQGRRTWRPLPQFGDGFLRESGPPRRHVTETDTPRRYRKSATAPARTRDRPRAASGQTARRPLPQFGDGYLREPEPPRRHVTKDDTLGVTGNRRQRLPAPGTTPRTESGPTARRPLPQFGNDRGIHDATRSHMTDSPALPQFGDSASAPGTVPMSRDRDRDARTVAAIRQRPPTQAAEHHPHRRRNPPTLRERTRHGAASDHHRPSPGAGPANAGPGVPAQARDLDRAKEHTRLIGSRTNPSTGSPRNGYRAPRKKQSPPDHPRANLSR